MLEQTPKEIAKQIKITVGEIFKDEFKSELAKDLSYLIYLCQLYERKGGKKDLW